jgi:hypothetical protein
MCIYCFACDEVDRAAAPTPRSGRRRHARDTNSVRKSGAPWRKGFPCQLGSRRGPFVQAVLLSWLIKFIAGSGAASAPITKLVLIGARNRARVVDTSGHLVETSARSVICGLGGVASGISAKVAVSGFVYRQPIADVRMAQSTALSSQDWHEARIGALHQHGLRLRAGEAFSMCPDPTDQDAPDARDAIAPGPP